MEDLIKQLAENEAKRTQNRTDLESIRANKNRLEEEMAVIEAKLAEAKKPKPKLRHGDVRHWPMASTGFYDGLWSITDASDKDDIKQVWIDGAAHSIEPKLAANIPDSVALFNLVDDLKALQENVTEFEMGIDNAPVTNGKVGMGQARVPSRLCWLSISEGIGQSRTVHMTLDEFEEFTMNCRKKLATLKRK